MSGIMLHIYSGINPFIEPFIEQVHVPIRVRVESILGALEQRNKTAIARTDWERREAHQYATPKIEKLLAALREPGVAREIVVAEDKPFTAKSEVREFLERAETPTLVVDAYVGVGTLDCFRTMKVPIRLLTGTHNNSMEAGFENALKAF